MDYRIVYTGAQIVFAVLFLTMPGDDINMSMSFGAEKYDESMNIRSFIDGADQKLYKSKEKKQKALR